MAINFNDYLKMTGLGESAPVTRRKRKNVKPGKFNPIAFAEAYSYAIQDNRRMRLTGIANQREGSRIAARGEAGLEDAKQFIKDKSKQAWEFLKKLYEKVIKFFTETLRYLMSNERKIGKAIAKLKAAKKTNKDNVEINIPVYTELIESASESYYGFGEKVRGQRVGVPRESEPAPGYRPSYTRNKNNGYSTGESDSEPDDRDAEIESLRAENSSIKKETEALKSQLDMVTRALAKRANKDKAKAAEETGLQVVAAVVTSPAVAGGSGGTGGNSGNGPTGGNDDDGNPRNLPATIPAEVTAKAKEGASKAKAVMKELTSGAEEVSKYQGRYFLIFGNLLVDAYTAASARLDCASGFETLVEGNDEVSDTINEFKEITKALFKAANEGNGTVKGSKADYIEFINTYISGLEKIKASRPMFGIQKTIRDLQAEKSKLDKDRKKESFNDKTDDGKTLAYQLRRGALQGKIKLANLYISVTDKAIGKILSVGGKIAAAA